MYIIVDTIRINPLFFKVLEYPENCMDLFDFISMKGPLDEKTARHIFCQVRGPLDTSSAR